MPELPRAPIEGAHVVGVSIRVPDPYGSELRARRASYGDPLARDVPTHVTLLGPTVVAQHRLPDLVAHLDRVAAHGQPFAMVLRGTGTFRPVSSVVFVQVAKGIAGCERLEGAIRTGAYAADLEFPYHPHVTVAHNLPDDRLDRAFEELADYRAAFDVTEFWLHEQDALGTWNPLQSFPLQGVAGPGAGDGQVR